MNLQIVKATFSRGELSPRLHGRIDIDHYRMGLEQCKNFYVLRQGGLSRRPGTVFVAELKDSSKSARLLPFVFNEQQAYVLEFGNEYCRFFALDGRVETSSAPYEISHPYKAEDLGKLHFAQSADVLYLAHGDYPPQTLTRKSEVNWEMAPFSAEDGPYLEENETLTSLTPNGSGAPHPFMSSNIVPASYKASSSNGSSSAWHPFDANIQSELDLGSVGDAWVELELNEARAVDAYILKASRNYPDRHPISWSLQAYGGSGWIILHRVNDETGWNRGESRSFVFPNKRAFSRYRLLVHSTGDNNNAVLGTFLLHWMQSQQTGLQLTASSTTGINGGTGFGAGDVGRTIRLYGSDGVWRWSKIVNVLSDILVEITIGDQALPDLEPIYRWRLSCWNGFDGYPGTVAFYNERLAWAGNKSFPRSIWFSETANYQSHRISDPVVDSDGLNITMTGGQINKIQWIRDIYDLAAGTTQSIRSVGAASSSVPFSNSNIEQRQQTTIGSTDIQPLSIGETTIYADYFTNRLHEFTYSFELNGYQAPELSVLSDHIFQSGITSLSYQSVPDNLIWVGLENGRLGCVTFEKSQAIAGMVQVMIAGGSEADAVVESHCTVPTAHGDRLWMIVKRTINGQVRRTIEYLAQPYDGQDLADAVYLDASVQYSGDTLNELTDLDHLEGERIGIFADGYDVGDAVVLNGSVTLPHGGSASKVVAGLRYESRGKTLRMAHPDPSGGSTFAQHKKLMDVTFDVMDAGSLKVGTPKRQFELFERETDIHPNTSKKLYTGMKSMNTQGGWSSFGQIVFHTNQAYPVTLRAVVAGLTESI